MKKYGKLAALMVITIGSIGLLGYSGIHCNTAHYKTIGVQALDTSLAKTTDADLASETRYNQCQGFWRF